jgi:hypothetical protein
MAFRGDSKPKKKRYLQKVKKEWLEEPHFSVYTRHSAYEVSCKVCSRKTIKPVLLNVSGRGKPVLIDHLQTEKHKNLVKEGYGVSHGEDLQENLDEFMGVNKQVCIVLLLW